MVVDTGASHTIVRRNILPDWRVATPSKKYIITTANGETMDVSGEMIVDIELGCTRIPHKVFVADITDPVILGMDFMDYHGVVLDVGQRSMRIGNEEFILKYNREPGIQTRQIILAENLVIPARSELVTSISVENDLGGMIGLLETASATNSGILLGRTLTSATTTTIPAR